MPYNRLNSRSCRTTTPGTRAPVHSVSFLVSYDSILKLATAFIQRPMAINIQAPAPRSLPSLQSTPSSEERPSLPSLGFDISRPSSTSTQGSSHHSQFRHISNPIPTIQLPALSTLASLASLASTSSPADGSSNNGYVKTVYCVGLHFRSKLFGVECRHLLAGRRTNFFRVTALYAGRRQPCRFGSPSTVAATTLRNSKLELLMSV